MTPRGLTLLAVFGLVLSSCTPDVGTLPKSITLSPAPHQTLFMNGRWVVKTAPEHSSLPTANSVQVICVHDRQRCTESLALLYSPTDHAMSSDRGSYLAVLTQEYEVVEWTETTITARAQPRAANLEIRVSLLDHSADRVARETAARGAM